MMTVAVTGASGHIGANLVRALLARGGDCSVRALHLDDDGAALSGLPLESVRRVDILDASALARAFEGVELVFHLAARITFNGDPDGSVLETNLRGTSNVAAACRAAGVRRLVHFSSIHALKHAPWDAPLDETRPLADEGRRCLTYDRTKAAAERAIRAALESGLDAVIVNPTAVIGPFDFKPSALGAVALKIARQRLPGLVDAGFDWVDVRDVCAGAIAAAERGRCGERYLLSGRWAPFAEYARALADAAGVRPPRFVSPLWLARLGAPFSMAWAKLAGIPPLATFESLETLETSHRAISHAKAERELGYRARPLAETAADVIGWFRVAGMLPPTGRGTAKAPPTTVPRSAA